MDRNLELLHSIYSGKSSKDITARDGEYILSELKQLNEISSCEDAKEFLQLLRLCREFSKIGTGLLGRDAYSTYNSMLAANSDGVYSANDSEYNDRFIYELIQNVDDCKYHSIEDCNLTIKFDFERDSIQLEYNETGFTCLNVIAITGIGDSTKNRKKATNLSDDRKMKGMDLTEIGEKGIGFKSVFGFARETLIQSGYYSFKLNKNDPTLPELVYDRFKYSPNTKMNLQLEHGITKNLYEYLKRKYANKENLINENPVVFLNKLSRISYYHNEKDHFTFEVSRSEQSSSNDFCIEDDVQISLSIMDKWLIKKSLSCYRYTQPVEYDLETCRTRYGAEEHNPRNHRLIAIVPKPKENIKKGKLYSFFPTETEVTVPFIIHAPFKLGAGRTKIDFVKGADGKLIYWQMYTHIKLYGFLHEVYKKLSDAIGVAIINYIPSGKNGEEFIFKNTLKSDHYGYAAIAGLPIFKATDDQMYSLSKLCVFDERSIEPHLLAISHTILQIKKPLFNASIKELMSRFGDLSQIHNKLQIEIQTNLLARLFEKIISENIADSDIAHCANLLHKYDPEIETNDMLKSICPKRMQRAQVLALLENPRLVKWFNSFTVQQIKSTHNNEIENRIFDERQDDCKDDMDKIRTFADGFSGVKSGFREYLQTCKFVKIDLKSENEKPIYIATGSHFYGSSPLEDLSDFYQKIDNRSIDFQIMVRLENQSAMIDQLCSLNTEVSDELFIEKLSNSRKIQKAAMGKMYGRVVKLINDSGVDQNRFMNELLQNADDCTYLPNDIPIFKASFESRYLNIAYNEKGFTRDNIRAITAIGESTKRNLMLSDSGEMATGEKGIGFKSVFSICSEVEIHSGLFHFRLTKEEPTIPQLLPGDHTSGTTMRFKLDKAFSSNELSDNNLIRLFLCLKQLKTLIINGKEIIIADTSDNRRVTIGGENYDFQRFVYSFMAIEDNTLEERRQYKDVSKEQRIIYYIPPTKYKEYYLYNTLPTSIEIRVPIIIDAFFELSTSREQPIQCDWNGYVKNAVYEGLIALYNNQKSKIGIKILDYMPLKEEGLFNCFYLNNTEFIQRIGCEPLFMEFNFNEWLSIKRDHDSNAKLLSDVEFYALEHWGYTHNGQKVYNYLDAIDCYKVSEDRHVKLLKLGAEDRKIKDTILALYEKYDVFHVDKLNDTDFHKLFFGYLKKNQESIQNEPSIQMILRNCALIPIRTKSEESSYIAYTDNIYCSDFELSGYEYFILDEKLMSLELFDSLFGVRIQAFNDGIIEIQYRKKLIEMLYSKPGDKEIAQKFFEEFQNNKSRFLQAVNSYDFPRDDIILPNRNGEFKKASTIYYYKAELTELSYTLVSIAWTEYAQEIGILEITKIRDYLYDSFELSDYEGFLKLPLEYSDEFYDSVFDMCSFEDAFFVNGGVQFLDLLDRSSHTFDKIDIDVWSVITLSNEAIKQYNELITQLSVNYGLVFKLMQPNDIGFDRIELLEEIKTEITLKFEENEVSAMTSWLEAVTYTDAVSSLYCGVELEGSKTLLISANCRTESDVLSAIKDFFKEYFKASLSVSRNITTYSRAGYKNIVSTPYCEKDIKMVITKLHLVEFSNISEKKDFLLKPLRVNGSTYGGYAKTCPFCGAKVHTELTGFRLYKMKQETRIYEFICCSNCYDNFRYASSLIIDEQKFNENGMIQITANINGYNWAPKPYKSRLAHFALIKSTNIRT